jgi:NaMN:DMB phosphoribosyltransferase
MSSITLCVMLAGFIAMAAILAIHFIRDTKASTRGPNEGGP